MTHVGEHDPALVALSVSIAILGSYTALDLATRAGAADGLSKRLWLLAAAVTMGASIWAMHFLGMLAFHLPEVSVSYHLGLTALSLAAPVSITAAGFLIAARQSDRLVRLVASGTIVGLGIVAMHYIGMSAIRGPITLSFAPSWVAASIAWAIGAAVVAIWLAFQRSGLGRRLLASLAMGFAVSGMHYVAMLGVSFTHDPDPSSVFPTINRSQLAVWVAITSFVLLLTGLAAATLDRRFRDFAEARAGELRASEERFRLLVQAVQEYAIFLLDPDGKVANWNAGAERIKGYRSDEVVGMPYELFFNAEDRAARLPETALAAARHNGQYKGEGWHVRRDGSVFLANFVIDPVADQNGRWLGYAVIVQDVTERRRAQQDLETAQQALAQAQKLEAIGQLTGGVAHDFNNLLMAIVGSLDLLKKRVPEDAKTRRLIENARHAADRGSALTQRLLAFARKQDLHPEVIDARELVLGMIDLLRHMIGVDCRIETRLEAEARVSADPNQLELALLNLCVNARDAMPAGGTITISVRALAAGNEPVPDGLPGTTYVNIAVTDTGTGMDEETLRRAQEPFFTTKGVGKGTGLGLSMVQGTVAQSGGKLVLSSKIGFGTTAEIWLPSASSTVSDCPVPLGRSAGRCEASPLTVLLVDDDQMVLESAAAMLEDLGHSVIVASSGPEALQHLEQTPAVDLLITDYLMPNMNGGELIREIRRRRPMIPAILASGYADQVDAPGTIRLNKPFDQRKLAEAIDAGARDPNVHVAAAAVNQAE